ncbi:MAG TPA: hypothetical protein VGX94_06320 [Terriglobia bacterium]|nr:hypothetical protein [Terriglobia bacterium]
MDGTIGGCLIDAVTGEILLSPTLSLTRHGVLGESLTQVDEHGRFVFRSLPTGSYCLGALDDRYTPLYHRLTLGVWGTTNFADEESISYKGCFIRKLLILGSTSELSHRLPRRG